MRIIYEAFDGKQFDNEFDCKDYEYEKLHPNLYTIDFIDKDEKIFHISPKKTFDDNTYWRAEKVIIHNNAELSDFLSLAEYCGWSEFEEQIISSGFWTRKEDAIGNPHWELK